MKSDHHYSSSKAYISPSWNVPREELWIINRTTNGTAEGRDGGGVPLPASK